jgi:hypothetical protein
MAWGQSAIETVIPHVNPWSYPVVIPSVAQIGFRNEPCLLTVSSPLETMPVLKHYRALYSGEIPVNKPDRLRVVA